jgi:Tir chaperone protein (CesT) family
MLALQTAANQLASELGGEVTASSDRFRIQTPENVLLIDASNAKRVVLAAVLRPLAPRSERFHIYRHALRFNAARLRHGDGWHLSVDDQTDEAILWREMFVPEVNETEFFTTAEALLNEVDVWHRYLDSV